MALDPLRQPSSREALLQHIAELELQLQQRDEELAAERERSSRARKKARQLLAKLAERDEALAELKAALENVRAAACASTPAATSVSSSGAAARALGAQRLSRQTSNLSGAEESRRPSRQQSAPNSPRQGGEAHGAAGGAAGGGGRDLAVRRRTEIVAQLEGHLAQMRANLEESEREVRELQDRKRSKELEWSRLPEHARSGENTQAHHAALAMISHQVLEKKSFAKELTKKTRELEEQVAKQRSLIEDHGHRSGSSNSEAEAAQAGAPRRNGSGPPKHAEGRAHGAAVAKASETVVACQDEALSAFLTAAGAAADVVLGRPSLRAAFESKPPQLSGGAIDDCSPEERSHALSLFTAWVAVAGASPSAMRMCEIALTPADVSELRNTLQACGAQLELWEMTRCPASDATVRLLFSSLTTQPLAHLNLSYNTLGPSGASALVASMPAWTPHLQTLILEMNGLGDKGCQEVAGMLVDGLLPALRVLELGWNELSAASAPVLSRLLAASGDVDSQAPTAAPRLHKLGLGGNGLGSEGARSVMLAALSLPSRALDLDLSMNHIGSQPLRALCEWAEAQASCDVRVSMNLEWNIVDDSQVVWRLAKGMANKGGGAGSAGGGARQTIVRLANNELIDLDPASVLAESGGLVSL